MRFGLKLFALNVQIDFLIAKLERLARDGRRTANKGLERHTQHARIKINTCGLKASGKYEVIEMGNHGNF